MAKYLLNVPNCIAQQIKSSETFGQGDQLAASIGLTVTNPQGALHQQYPAKHLVIPGTWGNGANVQVELNYPSVDVPDPDPAHQMPDGGAIYWSIVLVNTSEPGDPALGAYLESAAAGISSALMKTGNVYATAAGVALMAAQPLIELLTKSCDGVLVAQTFSLTALELQQATQSGSWHQTIEYPDPAPASGCNAFDYEVAYEIGESLVTVPNVVHMLLGDAEKALNSVGLVPMVTTQQGGEQPFVVSQDPAPGTQRSPGDAVGVVVLQPTHIRT